MLNMLNTQNTCRILEICRIRCREEFRLQVELGRKWRMDSVQRVHLFMGSCTQESRRNIYPSWVYHLGLGFCYVLVLISLRSLGAAAMAARFCQGCSLFLSSLFFRRLGRRPLFVESPCGSRRGSIALSALSVCVHRVFLSLRAESGSKPALYQVLYIYIYI